MTAHRAVLDGLNEAAVTVSLSGGSVWSFNAAASRLWGWEGGEVLEGPSRHLFPSGEDAVESIALALRGGKIHQSIKGMSKDGRVLKLEVSVSMVTAEVDGQPTELLTILAHDPAEALKRTTAIMNSALNAIVCADPNGSITLFNTSAGRVFRYDDAQVEGLNLCELIVPEGGGEASPGQWMQRFLHDHAGGVHELQGRRGDGSLFPMRMSVSEVSVGDEMFFTAILRDVTVEKEAQAEVEREHMRTTAIMNSALNAIVCADPNGSITLFNTSAGRVFRYDDAQVEGLNLCELIVPEGGGEASPGQWMQRFLHDHAGGVHKLQGRRGDGSLFPMRMSVSEVSVGDEMFFTAILRDVTVEKEAQAEVEREHMRTTAIMNSALNAIVCADPNGSITLFNTSAGRVFRYDDAQVEGLNLCELIVPEGGGEASPGQWMQRFLHDHAGGVHELQGRRGDGSLFPMRMSVSEVSVGDEMFFTAILRDVTVEKEAQAEVEREHMRTTAIMDSALNAIVCADPNGSITLFNTSAGRVFRYDDAQVEGLNLCELIVPEGGGEASPGQWMQRFLHDHAGGVHELQGRRGDGSLFPMRMSVSEVSVGDEMFFTAILRDVTVEKEAQAEVEREHMRTTAIMDSALNAIVCADPNGSITLFNTSAGRVFRYDDAQVEGLNLCELIVPPVGGEDDENEEPAPGEWMMRYLHKHAGGVHELKGLRGDGTLFPMRMSVSEVEVDGGVFYAAILRDVTKEKEAAAKIEREHSRTVAIMDSALNAIVCAEPSGNITLFNKSAIQVFRYDEAHFEGFSLSSSPSNSSWGSTPSRKSHHEGALKIEAINLCELLVPSKYEAAGEPTEGEWMQRFLHDHAGGVHELQGRRGDGSLFPMRMSVSEVPDEGGVFYTAILRDVTKEKEAQMSLELEHKRMTAIMDSVLNGIITVDRFGNIDEANASAGAIFGFSRKQDMHGANLSKLLVPPDQMNVDAAVDVSPLQQLQLQRRGSGGSPHAGAVGALGLPLRWMKDFLHNNSGSVQELLGRRVSDGTTFPIRMSVSEVEVEGELFYTAVLRDVTQEREAQAQMHLEQRRTNAIMSSALNAIISAEPDGTITIFNKSAVKVFRYAESQVEGLNLCDLIVPADGMEARAGMWMRQFLHQHAGGVHELQGRRGDGTLFPMRMSVSEVEVDGGVFYTAILRDVTKEKEAQAEAEKEHERTTAIINSVLNGIITVDKFGNIGMANKAAGAIFGYPEGELAASINLGKLVIPPAQTEVDSDVDVSPTARLKGGGWGMAAHLALPGRWMKDFLQNSAGKVQELIGRRSDGKTFPARMSVSEVEVRGELFYTAVLRDVSDERAQEHKVLTDQRRSAAIMNSAVNAIVTLEPNGGISMFNASATRVFGYSNKELDVLNLAELLIPGGGMEARPGMWMKQFLHAHAGRVHALQARRKGGQVFPVRMSVSEVEVDGGVFYTAIVMDITKEKEAEAQIEAEQRKTRAIMDSDANAIVTVDELGVIDLFNRSAGEVFGYAGKDVVGMNISQLIVAPGGVGAGGGGVEEGDYEGRSAWVPNFLKGSDGTAHDFEGRRSDGTTFPTRMTVSRVQVDDKVFYTLVMSG